MKTKAGAAVMSAVLVIVAVVLWVAPAGAADTGVPRIAPPSSHAYGMTLPEWFGAYYRWYYGTDQNPALSMVGHVQLMPLPIGEQVPGSDPPVFQGTREIALRPGTPFVLPLAGFVGERYATPDPGWPDDSPLPDDQLLEGIQPTLTIDGRVIVSEANKAAFYIPYTRFDPIVDYPVPTDYGSVAAIFFQGVGIVSPPLSVGTHVIHLYERYTTPYWDYFYDNTWIVTVTAH
jgi:hypothetical protein